HADILFLTHKALLSLGWRYEQLQPIAKVGAFLYCVQTAVGVEKVHFPQNSENLGDRKCLGKSRKSFVGHPDAILFLRISQKGVFQQPRLFASTINLVASCECKSLDHLNLPLSHTRDLKYFH